MSQPPLHKALPKLVDPRKFALQGLDLDGIVAVADLPRFAEALADTTGEVVVELKFALDEQRKKTLRGTVKAQVKVVCQRCLESTPLVVSGELNLAVVWDEDQAKALPKSLDPWITGEGIADLYAIIEEELLLNLPIASYHDTECVDKALFSTAEDEGDEREDSKQADNPFQVLEQLKGSPKH